MALVTHEAHVVAFRPFLDNQFTVQHPVEEVCDYANEHGLGYSGRWGLRVLAWLGGLDHRPRADRQVANQFSEPHRRHLPEQNLACSVCKDPKPVPGVAF